jgi:hypothetical protein
MSEPVNVPHTSRLPKALLLINTRTPWPQESFCFGLTAPTITDVTEGVVIGSLYLLELKTVSGVAA